MRIYEEEYLKKKNTGILTNSNLKIKTPLRDGGKGVKNSWKFKKKMNYNLNWVRGGGNLINFK